MKNQVVNQLSRIASAKYQHRYIRMGTKDAYVLPEELIETALGTITFIFRHPQLCRSLSEAQLAALRRFEGIASSPYDELFCNPAVTSGAAILEHPDWQHLRHAAELCLAEFDMNVGEWEADMK